MIDGQLSKRRQLTLGADPEIFVFAGNKLMPAYEFLPPKQSNEMIYWDGFQAEWKYNHEGSHCQNNLVLYTRERIAALTMLAKQRDPNARLSLTNVVRIPKETLQNAHPQHVELGCQPSYNAYDMRGKPVPNPRELVWRFAGGHKHLGTWSFNRRPPYVKIVKTMDSILGVWSVGVARHIDVPVRRQYYGLAGEYRMPEYSTGYGVEYRVLSNWWLASPAVMQLSWDIARMCVRLACSRYGKLWAGNQEETIDVINNCDYDQADKIMRRNKPMFTWLLNQVYRTPKAVEKAISISTGGLHSVVPNPDDFTNNWHMGDEWIPNGGQPWARWETSL